MARAIIEEPELVKAVILDAPFLDISGMLIDENKPLNQSDYEEFGNANIKSEFESILKICPYYNINKLENSS